MMRAAIVLSWLRCAVRLEKGGSATGGSTIDRQWRRADPLDLERES
jgi:hypothetical protein